MKPCVDSQTTVGDESATKQTKGPSTEQVRSALDIVCGDKAYSGLLKELISTHDIWSNRPTTIEDLGNEGLGAQAFVDSVDIFSYLFGSFSIKIVSYRTDTLSWMLIIILIMKRQFEFLYSVRICLANH